MKHAEIVVQKALVAIIYIARHGAVFSPRPLAGEGRGRGCASRAGKAVFADALLALSPTLSRKRAREQDRAAPDCAARASMRWP